MMTDGAEGKLCRGGKCLPGPDLPFFLVDPSSRAVGWSVCYVARLCRNFCSRSRLIEFLFPFGAYDEGVGVKNDICVESRRVR